jgi:hypothetical protein
MTYGEQQSSFPYDGMTRSGSKGISQSTAQQTALDTPNEWSASYWKYRQNATNRILRSRFLEIGRNILDKRRNFKE